MNDTFLLIGNPENRRVVSFENEARRAGCTVRVAPWVDVIARPLSLLEVSDERCLVRLDSWGENVEVRRALLRRGADVEPASPARSRIPPEEIDEATADRGRIAAPRQEHDGLLAVLSELERVLASRPGWASLQPISALRIAFDKRATHSLAARLGIPVPPALVPATEDVVSEMERAGMRRAYVKVTCSSSASCLALVERSPQGVSLVTTVEVDGERLYNSLRVRRYARASVVERVLRFLMREGAHVEQAIEKMPLDGRHADVRIVMIRGAEPFAVVRTSQTPLTNLHLGGTRGDLAAYQRKLPQGEWSRALDSGEALRAALGAWHLGVDVAFDRDTGAAYLLEANAFGDLLPSVERAGESIYASEIRAARAWA